ncbi:uncharacterized protein [Rutidosis leptorrhynchoides]|uniref:uncharacterized protein n=1 Tax=Rutidosis leptorrhynchoides TaxID=125765 RepID=UPI003A9940CC
MVPLVAPVDKSEPNWMTHIIAFFRDRLLPADSVEASKVCVKAPMYPLEESILYRKIFLGPPLRCIGPREVEEVVREVHKGSCTLHSGHRSIASKIMRLEYYWPTLYINAASIVKLCESCQIHAPISRAHARHMIPVSSPWPFYKLAIDIVRKFPRERGNTKFLIVANDYFAKWVEARLLATISGKKFSGDSFFSWCAELNIKHNFTSVAHPQANGQCKVTNRDIVAGIKARLGYARTGWVDELPKVLWSHRTTPKASTGETPFSLV